MEESWAEEKKPKNVVRRRGATSFNSSSFINSTQVTIALLNRVRTAGENSTSFLVEALEKPPFFSLLLIPTGGSPSSSLGLSSNIYNPKSKALASLWKASRERDLLFPLLASRTRSAPQTMLRNREMQPRAGKERTRQLRGAPARSRRSPSPRRAGLAKLRAEDAGLSCSPRPSRGAPGRASLLASLAPRRRPQRRRERGRPGPRAAPAERARPRRPRRARPPSGPYRAAGAPPRRDGPLGPGPAPPAAASTSVVAGVGSAEAGWVVSGARRCRRSLRGRPKRCAPGEPRDRKSVV